MKNLFNKYKYELIILIVVGVLFILNYRPGSYLSGWDNLQTELNPWLAVKRSLFSVWEEYQSMGLVAGMAHGADLPRAFLLFITSFFIPENLIRYLFHFGMLLLGGIGAFKLFKDKINHREYFPLLGSLFYILNLGTLQIFYVPFEPFSTFFALLPWGIWIFEKLIIDENKHFEKKALLTFVLINIFGIPSFYTQQLFVVYLSILACITIGFYLSKRNILILKKSVILAFLIIIVNSFWILPQVYFLKTNNGWISQNKGNQLATEDVFYQNQNKGNLNSFLRMEGFYYDLSGINNQQLFLPWKYHFQGAFKYLPYLFAILMIVGAFHSLSKKSKGKDLGMILLLMFCALALLSATPPFSWLNITLRQNTLINQMFRSPFTKFIIPFALVYSYFFAQGLLFINDRVKKNRLVFSITLLIIILYSLPSFKGYLFSSEMKTNLPKEYKNLIKYFNNEDKNKRISLLPDYTFWGWFFHKWGYNGSGFLWYGIEQPIISRTFDVWSPVSENYFWEEKQALESENVNKLENVWNKYKVDYVLVDNSLIPVISTYKSLQYDRIDNLLSQSHQATLVFKEGPLTLYKIFRSNNEQNFVSLISGIPNIGPSIRLNTDDKAYEEYGTYLTDINSFDIIYPYSELTTLTNVAEKKWKIEEKENKFTMNTLLNINPGSYSLNVDDNFIMSLFNNNKLENIDSKILLKLDNQTLSLSFEKKLIKTFDVSNQLGKDTFGYTISDLPQKYGYIVKIKTKHIEGSPYFFYISDETKNQSITEEKLRNELSYFILPPRFNYGLGYSFVFQNKSYENYPALNNLLELSIYALPYENIKSTKLIKKNFRLNIPYFYDNFKAKKVNYFTYKVQIDQPIINDTIVYLSQSYDVGWIAFTNGKFLTHVKINNWSNGWKIPEDFDNNSKITIIFWPQYLEFLGFALLAIAFLSILLIKKRYD